MSTFPGVHASSVSSNAACANIYSLELTRGPTRKNKDGLSIKHKTSVSSNAKWANIYSLELTRGPTRKKSKDKLPIIH